MTAKKPRAASAPVLGDPTAIAEPLRRWYLAHRRDLPWRRTRDPYAVWLSEIMCQQTRVSVVIPYFERFLARFPTPADLAAAAEDEVLSLWAGLGYYSRGRNLRRAAIAVVEEHDGVFPDSLAGIRSLPGVGEYTAAAIGSIVFAIAEPVIDGNVERVLARHGAIAGDVKKGEARREVRESARHALDVEHPGDHNQAMMELGATVCTPRNPQCDACPIATTCRARAIEDPERFPPPRVRRSPETQHWVALVLPTRDGVWTFDRDGDEELLPGHRGVPITRIPDHATADAPPARRITAAARALLAEVSPEGRGDARTFEVLEPVRHSITYRRLRVHPVLPRDAVEPSAGNPTPLDGKERARLPALFRKILDASLPPGGGGDAGG